MPRFACGLEKLIASNAIVLQGSNDLV